MGSDAHGVIMKITLNKTPITLPELFRQLRLEGGFSQSQIARLTGSKSRRRISHYETGNANVAGLSLLDSIASLCGYDLEVRVTRKEPVCTKDLSCEFAPADRCDDCPMRVIP